MFSVSSFLSLSLSLKSVRYCSLSYIDIRCSFLLHRVWSFSGKLNRVDSFYTTVRSIRFRYIKRVVCLFNPEIKKRDWIVVINCNTKSNKRRTLPKNKHSKSKKKRLLKNIIMIVSTKMVDDSCRLLT